MIIRLSSQFKGFSIQLLELSSISRTYLALKWPLGIPYETESINGDQFDNNKKGGFTVEVVDRTPTNSSLEVVNEFYSLSRILD